MPTLYRQMWRLILGDWGVKNSDNRKNSLIPLAFLVLLRVKQGA